MKMTIRCLGFDRTPAIESYLEKKLLKLTTFFANPERLNLFVKCSEEHDDFRCEVTLRMNDLTLRAEQRSHDLYDAIDAVEKKIIRQIHKYKTRLHRHVRRDLPVLHLVEEEGDDQSEPSLEIVRRKGYLAKPMTAEEAILEMNMLDHSFFVFQDAETGETHVVYKRRDGKYGLISPEQAIS